MKLVTWNVNSIRARHERLLAWLGKHHPDVLCLQELKVEDGRFPFEEIEAAGYRASIHGQKAYNGVAILSREEPTDIRRTLEDDVDDPQARLISLRVAGVRVVSVYVPNGSEVGSSMWTYKLAWMKRLQTYAKDALAAGEPLVICGDFNVVPDDKDVANPESWRDTVLCHDEIRASLDTFQMLGFTDVFRAHNPEGGVYSWWDYRRLGFPKNDGLRIDLIYASRDLAPMCTAAYVDRDERKGKKPSDHAPVIAEFE